MSTSTRNPWTTGEIRLLARLYPSHIPSKALYAAFPRHPRKSVQTYGRTVLKISRPPRDHKSVAARHGFTCAPFSKRNSCRFASW